MRKLIALAVLLLIAATAKADTVNFTLTADAGTGNTVSFSLQQGQAPDTVMFCGCGGGIEGEFAHSEYFNVPLVENGVNQIGNVFFCDVACDDFSDVQAGGLTYFGGNTEPWSGLLTSPQFVPGSYQSMVICAGSLSSRSARTFQTQTHC